MRFYIRSSNHMRSHRAISTFQKLSLFRLTNHFSGDIPSIVTLSYLRTSRIIPIKIGPSLCAWLYDICHIFVPFFIFENLSSPSRLVWVFHICHIVVTYLSHICDICHICHICENLSSQSRLLAVSVPHQYPSWIELNL